MIPFSMAPQLSEADDIAVPGAYTISPPTVLPNSAVATAGTVFVVKVKDEEEEHVSHYVLVSLQCLYSWSCIAQLVRPACLVD